MRWRSLFLITFTLLASSAALGQKTLPDGVKDLAGQISSSMTKEQKNAVAVITFRELDGQTTVLGAFIAEELVTHLVNAGLRVVERSMLDKLLSEQRLQQSGAVDPTTAKQVGKIAGVDAVVIGSVTDLASQIGINCRLIDTETGNIFAAAQTKITKDDDVKKVMGIVLPAPAGAVAPAKRPSSSTARSWERGGVRHIIEAAKRDDENDISLVVVLEHDKSENVATNPGEWHLIDNNGDYWTFTGDSKGIVSNGGATILPATRLRSTFRFRCYDGSCNGTSFTIAHKDRTVLLRNLSIQ